MPRISDHIAILECTNSQTLEETLSNGLAPFVVRRLSDRVVVLDHNRMEAITKLLRRHGQTPRITKE